MRNSFCIESVSTTHQISASPMNTSTSKQLYSFSKEYRFKKPMVYCDNIYNIPSAFRQLRTASRSSRNNLHQSTGFIASKSKRHLNSAIEMHRSSSRKGLSLNESRMRIPDNHRYEHVPLNQGPTYSMRKRLVVIDKKMSIEPQNENPGAGTYQNPQALSPSGKYFVDKHQSTSYTRFNPRSSRRFFEFKNINPGPGNYNEINGLSNSGHYSLSKTHGDGKRFFDKERRVVLFEHRAKKNYNPGPGSYRSPSDFGHYDGDVYSKTGGISYITSNNLSSFSRKPSRSRF